MKTMKKLTALVVAVVMVLAMAVTTFADVTHKITAPATDHQYEIYQIFTGDISDGKLVEVKWGANGTGTLGTAVDTTILDALTEIDATASNATKLAEITKYANLTISPVTTITNGGSYDAAPGYYLIKDKDKSLENKDDSYTTYIVKVLDSDLTISPKSSKPSVDKEVQDEVADKENGADAAGWGETADHEIGESFQFKLVATLTADPDYADYPTYKVVFHDTMSSGVTFESIESVDINGTAITDYTCTATEGTTGEWSLTITDAKSYGVDITKGATITVIYNAHLNEFATVTKESGSTDNENKVYLEYSNNPNASGEGETGKTPEDYVWVFTYGVDNVKVKDTADGDPLSGAGFTLYDADGNAVQLYAKDGAYYVYNEKAPAGVTPITEMTTPENGQFNIKGLDVGTYRLEETTVPEGYNKCADTQIVIAAEHSETDPTTNHVDMTKSQNMDNTIVNKSGATLPETGGMGTTVIYIVGAILVLGAGVLLITRRRLAK